MENRFDDRLDSPPSGNPLVDLLWSIYSSLELKVSIDHFSQLRGIYYQIKIIEEVILAGGITPDEYELLLIATQEVQNLCENEIALNEVEKKLQVIIKRLKLNNTTAKAIVLINQISDHFFSDSPRDKELFDQKIAPVKKAIKEHSSNLQWHELSHLLKRVDSLYNEKLDKEALPQKEILEIIEDFIRKAS